MTDRIEMTVKLQVTPAQGLTLQAMFEHWNLLSSMGSSRYVGLFVDGDGNFHPKAQVSFDGEIPELTEELRTLSHGNETNANGDLLFDFDAIAWELHK